MADLKLSKPLANEVVVAAPQADDRLILDFNSGDAQILREGDNLVFAFEDKASLVLQDFYTAYSSDNMPEFEILGAVVSGEQFFAALDDELMPALGPAGNSPQGGGTVVGLHAAQLLSAEVEALESAEILGFAGEHEFAGLRTFNIDPLDEPSAASAGSEGAGTLPEASDSILVELFAAGPTGPTPVRLVNGTLPSSADSTFSINGHEVTDTSPYVVTDIYGTFTFYANGEYSYAMAVRPGTSIDSNDVIGLPEGYRHENSHIVTITGADGVVSTETIETVLHGTNNSPEIWSVTLDTAALEDAATENSMHGLTMAGDYDTTAKLGYAIKVGNEMYHIYHDEAAFTAAADLYPQSNVTPVFFDNDTRTYTISTDLGDLNLELIEGKRLSYTLDDTNAQPNAEPLTVDIFVIDEHGKTSENLRPDTEKAGVLFGSENADTLTGTTDSEILYGGAGNDTLHGGSGDDYYYSKSDEVLYSGIGEDFLFGGSGDDILFGGVGDRMWGGTGEDLFILEDIDVPAKYNLEDVLLADGGDGMDILLAGVVDDATLKSIASVSENMELIVTGDIKSTNMADLLTELEGLGVTRDSTNKTFKVDANNWKDVDSTPDDGFNEYSYGDLTILIKNQII